MDHTYYALINLFCVALLALPTVRLLSAVDKQLSQRLLIWVFVSNMVGPLCECVYSWADGQSFAYAGIINLLANCIYFASTGIAGFLWLLYCMAVIGRPLRLREPRFWIATIPMDLLLLLVFVSLKTGWLFYIDEQNLYHRGPLHIVQMLLCFIYLIAVAVLSLRESRARPNLAERPQLYSLALYMLVPVVCAIIQFFAFGLPMLNIGLSFGFITIYLQAQDQQISRDSLTGTNNRSELYRHLYARISRFSPDDPLYLVIMDIDYFKSINDQYGHVEGDRALVMVGNALRRVFGGTNAIISRFGGDEFVVMAHGIGHSEFDRLCKKLNPTLAQLAAEEKTPYSITMSYGIAEYTTAIGNQQSFLRLADAELYKAKALRHTDDS